MYYYIEYCALEVMDRVHFTTIIFSDNMMMTSMDFYKLNNKFHKNFFLLDLNVVKICC